MVVVSGSYCWWLLVWPLLVVMEGRLWVLFGDELWWLFVVVRDSR